MLPLDNNTVSQIEAAAAALSDQEGRSHLSLFRRRGSRTCQASKNKKKKSKSEKELLFSRNSQVKQLIHGKQLLPHCSDHSNQCGKGNCSVLTMGTEGTEYSVV